MAKKERYEELANTVPGLIGGVENITFFTHCVTRLRFNVKDKSLVKLDEIEKINGVVGGQWSGEQLQIIIGQAVGDAYKLICEKTGLASQNSIDENLDNNKVKKKFSLNAVFDSISGCITPLIPVLIGAGFIKIIVLLCEQFGILAAGDPTHTLFTFVGDAGFYFFPIVLGYTAAKKFNVTPVIGMFLGCIMMHPTFVNMAVEGASFTVYGIPCSVQNYASTLLPIILTVWITSYTEKFLKKILPQSLKIVFVPFLTVVIMIPVSLCALGPVGAIVGNWLCELLLGLDRVPVIGFIAVAIIAALWEFLVMSGMHVVFITTLVMVFSQNGQESLVSVAGTIASMAVVGMLLGSFLKIKNAEEKNLTFGYLIAAFIGGVTEPGLYGNGMKFKKPFLGLLVGGFAGGLYAGISNVTCYAMVPVASFLGLTGFAGGSTMNLVNGLIASVIAIIVAAIVTYLFGYNKNDFVLKK